MALALPAMQLVEHKAAQQVTSPLARSLAGPGPTAAATAHFSTPIRRFITRLRVVLVLSTTESPQLRAVLPSCGQISVSSSSRSIISAQSAGCIHPAAVNRQRIDFLLPSRENVACDGQWYLARQRLGPAGLLAKPDSSATSVGS